LRGQGGRRIISNQDIQSHLGFFNKNKKVYHENRHEKEEKENDCWTLKAYSGIL